MNTILSELNHNSKFIELKENIENKKSPQAFVGLTDVGMIQLICSIFENTKKPICIITYNEIQAKKILQDIKYFTDKVIYFPKKEIVTYDYIAESKDLPYERIETLNKIYEKKNNILVTTVEAVMQKNISYKTLYKNVLKFKVGDIVELENLKQKLIDLGYTRYELIEGRRQFSIRGGIIDISLNENLGVRIELWGDEIDSIRYFNVTSQRSTEVLEKVTIYPAHEYILEKNINDVCKNIESKYGDNRKLEDVIKQDIEIIKNGNYISKIEKYFNSFYEEQENILNYLSDNYVIILDEISKLSQRGNNILIDNQNLIKALIEKEKFVLEALKNIQDFKEIEEDIREKQLI